MVNPFVSLTFDILIFISLSVTIYYCINLSRRFNEIQESRKTFENLIKSMNIASSKAEVAIKNLKSVINEEGTVLQDLINKAKGIEGELEIIIQAGDSLADRIEKASSNKSSKPSIERFVEEDEISDETIASFLSDDDGTSGNKTKAEIELLEAVRRRQG